MLAQEFHFKPSIYYFIFLILVSFMSLLTVIFLTLSILFKIIGFLLIIFYFYYLWRGGMLQKPESIQGIKHVHDRVWQITTARHTYQTTLLGKSTLTPFVSVLCFDKGKDACLVFCDSLTLTDYRRLLRLVRLTY